MKIHFCARGFKVKKITKATFLLSLDCVIGNEVIIEMRKKDLEHLLKNIDRALNEPIGTSKMKLREASERSFDHTKLTEEDLKHLDKITYAK